MAVFRIKGENATKLIELGEVEPAHSETIDFAKSNPQSWMGLHETDWGMRLVNFRDGVNPLNYEEFNGWFI